MNLRTTTGGLAKTHSRAQELEPQLAAATDELNLSICEAEKAIAALRLGVSASVTILEWDNGLHTIELTFAKQGKAWRLFLDESNVRVPDEDSRIPLTNASRELRLEAVGHLPQLVSEMMAQAERELERVQSRTQNVRDFVASLTGKEAPNERS